MNIKDVANKAGVSISTVSRVINNTAKVNPETRQKVEKVLKETNYRPNSLARELQQKKTNTIGIIMSTKDLDITSVSETLNEIADVLKSNGYNLMLANSRFNREEEFNIFRTFQEKRVDGVIYMATEFTDAHYELLKNYPAPLVIVGQQYTKLDIPCAIHSDYKGAGDATRFLIEKGHKDIGFIACPSNDIATGIIRKQAFYDVMEKAGLKINENYVKEGNFTIDSGYNCMEAMIMENKKLPTAVFATTDYMAIGAIKAIKDNGLKVPEDISVIGFDDVHVSAFLSPTLTTIHTDKRTIGKWAVQHLLKAIDKGEMEMNVFKADYQLKVRESVRSIEVLKKIL